MHVCKYIYIYIYVCVFKHMINFLTYFLAYADIISVILFHSILTLYLAFYADGGEEVRSCAFVKSDPHTGGE